MKNRNNKNVNSVYMHNLKANLNPELWREQLKVAR